MARNRNSLHRIHIKYNLTAIKMEMSDDAGRIITDRYDSDGWTWYTHTLFTFCTICHRDGICSYFRKRYGIYGRNLQVWGGGKSNLPMADDPNDRGDDTYNNAIRVHGIARSQNSTNRTYARCPAKRTFGTPSITVCLFTCTCGIPRVTVLRTPESYRFTRLSYDNPLPPPDNGGLSSDHDCVFSSSGGGGAVSSGNAGTPSLK